MLNDSKRTSVFRGVRTLNLAVAKSGALSSVVLTGVCGLPAIDGISAQAQTVAPIVLNSGTYDLGDAAQNATSLSGTGGTITTGGPSGSLILNQNADTTFSGNWSGQTDFFTDYLQKYGTGTLTLSGNNTTTGDGVVAIYDGKIAVSGGNAIGDTNFVTLSGSGAFELLSDETVGMIGGASSNGRILLNGNTLMIHGDGVPVSSMSGYFAGSISGTGSLILDDVSGSALGVSALTLAGTNTFTGPLTIRSGSILLVSGTAVGDNTDVVLSDDTRASLRVNVSETIGSLTAGAGSNITLHSGAVLTVNGNGKSTSVDGKITGAGGLAKQGTGVLTLNGRNDYTGLTVVDQGTLIVGDSVHASAHVSSSIRVRSNATLGGIGTLSDTMIEAGGVHSPGNSIGTHTINGDYTNHGTLAIEVAPPAADKLVVQGVVDITGATLALTGTPLAASDWPILNGPYVILDNQGMDAIAGTFADVTSNLLFLDEKIEYTGGDGNDVTLELIRNDISFADIGRTPNQRATGAAVDALPTGNAVWQAIVSMSDEDAARMGLSSLSGEAHPSFQGALNQNSIFLRSAANERIRTAFATSDQGMQPLSYGADENTRDAVPSGTQPAFWSEAYGSWADIDDDVNAVTMELSSGGLFAGADVLASGWRLGVLGGYGVSQLRAPSVSSSIDSKDYHLGLYAGTEMGRLGVRAGLGYSWHSIDSRRHVRAGALANDPSADYDAATLQAFGETSYRFDLAAASVEPFVNLAYVNQRSDRFIEQGGTAALSVSGQSMDTGIATLGTRVEHSFQLASIPATFNATVGWRHVFGDVAPTATHAFSGGSEFTVAGAPIARNAALIEAGLDFDLTAQSTVGLAYRGQISADVQEHGLTGMLAVRF